jgi:hypothetical protein
MDNKFLEKYIFRSYNIETKQELEEALAGNWISEDEAITIKISKQGITNNENFIVTKFIDNSSGISYNNIISGQYHFLSDFGYIELYLSKSGVDSAITASNDFEIKLQFISDDIFRYSYKENKDVDALQALIKTYDLELESTPTKTKLPTDYKTMSEEHIPFFVGTNLEVLQQLQQVQLMVMQNEL